jgi:hypothetical protein
MAVMVELHIAGTREQHDAADVKVSEALDGMGGPPSGLMFHLTWPDGDRFVVMNVWRTEDEALQFFGSVVRPAMAAVGLDAGEPRVRPVWGMGRPPG